MLGGCFRENPQVSKVHGPAFTRKGSRSEWEFACWTTAWGQGLNRSSDTRETQVVKWRFWLLRWVCRIRRSVHEGSRLVVRL